MLVITRRIGEILNIGDDIEVVVLGVDGRQVRLGIAAPRDVKVDRAEIRDRKNQGLPPPVKISSNSA
jgi:carbon storage regulator